MASHEERIRAIETAFAQANEALATRVQQLDEKSATTAPPQSWSPAQIAWHVAQTTDFLASALNGSNGAVLVPRPDGFEEKLATMKFPEKIQTFPNLEPPAGTVQGEALNRLRESQSTFSKALQAVTPDRASAQCVQLPFGVFSLYEIGEFTAAHVSRHIGQLERNIARA